MLHKREKSPVYRALTMKRLGLLFQFGTKNIPWDSLLRLGWHKGAGEIQGIRLDAIPSITDSIQHSVLMICSLFWKSGWYTHTFGGDDIQCSALMRCGSAAELFFTFTHTRFRGCGGALASKRPHLSFVLTFAQKVRIDIGEIFFAKVCTKSAKTSPNNK